MESVAVPANPDDSPILASLLVAEAECMVSGDSDLPALRDRHPILTPGEFADRL